MNNPTPKSITPKVLLLFVVLFSVNSATQAQSSSSIQPARASWDTGWFQTEVYRQLIQDLGYTVDEAQTMDNAEFYMNVGKGSIDFWVNGWTPLHQQYIEQEPNSGQIEFVGKQVEAGALQGFMIDKKSAEELNISSLADFSRPEVQRNFDMNNNGRADLVGCNPGWGCDELIEYQLQDFGLQSVIDHKRGPYSLLMQNTIKRFQQGEPIFFFTWTPNWTIGALKPGEDVVWIEVPGISTPSVRKQDSSAYIIQDPPGSQKNILLGSPPNDIQVVANKTFLQNHPDIHELFKLVKIPLSDILRQNARLLKGESDLDAIKRHAQEWIDSNRNKTEQWLSQAASLRQNNSSASKSSDTVQPNNAADSEITQEVLIVTQPVEPFVIYENGSFGGFTIDFMNMVFADLNISPTYYAVNSIAKLSDEIERGKADLGAAAISITSERESQFDLSHSYFDTGLQIMIIKEEADFLQTSWSFFKGLITSPDLWFVLLLFVIVLFVIANIIWLIEHKNNEDFPSSYFRGIFVSLWWSAVTVTTVGYGDKIPRRIAGKAFAMFWLFSGYFIFAYFTASVTSNFTVSELEGRIKSPDDLYGHSVITVNRSAAHAYLSDIGINPVPYGNISTAVNALKKGEGDAIVYDAPVLQYYAKNDHTGKLAVSGSLFEEKDYGILLPENSSLKNDINQELLLIQEDGRYQRLYQKWFGVQQNR